MIFLSWRTLVIAIVVQEGASKLGIFKRINYSAEHTVAHGELDIFRIHLFYNICLSIHIKTDT